MANCEYSYPELFTIAGMNVGQLSNYMQGKTVVQALHFRRQLQIGITNVRKKYGYKKHVIEGLLWATGKIEKWCRGRFVKDRTLELIRTDPECAKNKEKVKHLIKGEWETIITGASF